MLDMSEEVGYPTISTAKNEGAGLIVDRIDVE
jgi:hypothetical protein